MKFFCLSASDDIRLIELAFYIRQKKKLSNKLSTGEVSVLNEQKFHDMPKIFGSSDELQKTVLAEKKEYSHQTVEISQRNRKFSPEAESVVIVM